MMLDGAEDSGLVTSELLEWGTVLSVTGVHLCGLSLACGDPKSGSDLVAVLGVS